MKIAILGGTGDAGFGLGFRWALAGHEIIIGSRKTEKGEKAAHNMKNLAPQGVISGTNNLEAAEQAEIVVLSVPYEAQEATLDAVMPALSGKLLVTIVAPTGEKAARVRRLPSGLSAAEEAQQQVGDITRVVAAFQNIGAHHLLNAGHQLDYDVLICGDKAADKNVVMQLSEDAGMRGVNTGALQNASVAEGLTSLLIAVNVIYKVKSAGVRITGL